MSLALSPQGEALYNGTKNLISGLAKRVQSVTDAAYSFYTRYKIFTGYLYLDLAADFSIPANSSDFNIFVAGCNEVTLQPIGSAGTITVKGSLDGATFVTAVVTTTAEGFLRITQKYKWLQVSTSGSSGTYSIYMMIS